MLYSLRFKPSVKLTVGLEPTDFLLTTIRLIVIKFSKSQYYFIQSYYK